MSLLRFVLVVHLLLLAAPVLFAAPYGLLPGEFPGVSADDVDALGQDILDEGIVFIFGAYRLTLDGAPLDTVPTPLTVEQAHQAVAKLEGAGTYCFEPMEAFGVYEHLRDLAFDVAPSEAAKLRHLHTLVHAFGLKENPEFIRWQAFSGGAHSQDYSWHYQLAVNRASGVVYYVVFGLAWWNGRGGVSHVSGPGGRHVFGCHRLGPTTLGSRLGGFPNRVSAYSSFTK